MEIQGCGAGRGRSAGHWEGCSCLRARYWLQLQRIVFTCRPCLAGPHCQRPASPPVPQGCPFTAPAPRRSSLKCFSDPIPLPHLRNCGLDCIAGLPLPQHEVHQAGCLVKVLLASITRAHPVLPGSMHAHTARHCVVDGLSPAGGNRYQYWQE